jgi:carbohydrate kinase (thermoresistant glucokinase family)
MVTGKVWAILVVIGVSGVGKPTIAQITAHHLGWPFEEGDALDPSSNIAIVLAGLPLSDEDRRPWLEHEAAWIDDRPVAGKQGVITCSAICGTTGSRLEVHHAYLRGHHDLLARHLSGRHGHFVPAFLQSQINALEEPSPHEDCLDDRWTASGRRTRYHSRVADTALANALGGQR